MLGIPYNQVKGMPTARIVRIPYMTTLAERLHSALETREGLTKAGLARACGISAPSVNDWFSGKTKSISSAHLHAAAIYLGVDSLWLATGEGRMAPYAKNKELIEQPASGIDSIEVPLMNAAGSMGYGLLAPEQETIVDVIRLSRSFVTRNLPTISSPTRLAALTAYGDSMVPTFSDGDILFVDRGVEDIRVDAVYVLLLNNELYIKRIQRRITDGALIIKSDNPLYEPVTIQNGDRERLKVLGRVVWAWNGKKL